MFFSFSWLAVSDEWLELRLWCFERR